jgi:hypothetical protein
VRILALAVGLLAVGVSTTTAGRSSAVVSLRRREGADEGGDGDLPYRPDFFYATFLLASAYVGMVLTGWGAGGAGAQGEFGYDQGWASVWAKAGASWACAGLYTWSLVAHRVLPGRQF